MPTAMDDDRAFLTTPRLLLRDKTAADLDFIASLHADPRVMRWIADGSTHPYGEVEARFHRVLALEAAPGHERWDAFKIVVRREDGERLGQAGLLRCEIDERPDVEIGWWFAPAAWGRGYATEAATALRDFAFGELRLEHLSVVLLAANERSVGVARRIGGVPAGPARYRGRTVTRYVVRPPATATGAP
jgi:RimJ/RimL family protein N-acetyltransferase